MKYITIQRSKAPICLCGVVLLLCSFIITEAQPVADAEGDIGLGTAFPNPSAILDLTSTEKGLLPPRMSTTERNAIQNPASGLVIYNLTEERLEVNAGTSSLPVWELSVSN